LADLSIVILAERFETLRLLSFDERDFRAVPPTPEGKFGVFPDGGRGGAGETVYACRDQRVEVR
jgi:hypothetical protein